MHRRLDWSRKILEIMVQALLIPLLLTLTLHALLVAVFVVQWPGSELRIKKPAPQYVRAQLVTLDKPKAKPQATAKAKPAAQPKTKPTAQKKASAAAESKAVAQQREQAAREKAQLDKARKAAELERQQLAAQQAENEKRRSEQLQREWEEELASSIAQEEQLQQAQTDAELAGSYIALLTQAIQNNWNRPPSARNGMEAELSIQLVPTGEVVSVKIVRGSGNAEFDRSAEAAVLRAGRFEQLQKLPADVFEQYFRRLRIIFRPEDLRL